MLVSVFGGIWTSHTVPMCFDSGFPASGTGTVPYSMQGFEALRRVRYRKENNSIVTQICHMTILDLVCSYKGAAALLGPQPVEATDVNGAMTVASGSGVLA